MCLVWSCPGQIVLECGVFVAAVYFICFFFLMANKIQDGRFLVVIQEIIRHELHAKALIQDIQETVEDEQVLERIHHEVKKAVHAIKSNIEELEKLSKEQERESEREEILSHIEIHRQQLGSLQTALRKANLTAQIALEKRARLALLDESTETSARQRVKKDKEALTKLSSGVTTNLMSISRALSGQVIQSENTLQTLGSSSQKVVENQEELKTMGSIIHQSRKLLSKYNRREFTDKALIFLALVFFFACVLYVMKRRIF